MARDRGGDTTENLSSSIKPLHLPAQEKADLVAFMKSLTRKPLEVVVRNCLNNPLVQSPAPRLPQLRVLR
jgi:hypothetical protein